jgi:hypothetical protein
MVTLAPIIEQTRIAAPGPAPMALAYENGNLWVGSAKDWTVRGMRIADGAVFAEAKAPAKPYGGVLVENAFRVIVGDADDNRAIRDYPLGQTFAADSVRCPNDTGNFLAHDGTSLYVSQRFDKRLVEVDAHGTPRRTMAMPRQVVGLTIVGPVCYLLTTDGSSDDSDIRVARMQLSDGPGSIIEIARVPFGARSLVYDGAHFWTSWRERDLIVAFALPMTSTE